MTQPTRQTTPKVVCPRTALERRGTMASKTEPGRFNEKPLDDKIVEFLPMGHERAPIEGLDPKTPH